VRPSTTRRSCETSWKHFHFSYTAVPLSDSRHMRSSPAATRRTAGQATTGTAADESQAEVRAASRTTGQEDRGTRDPYHRKRCPSCTKQRIKAMRIPWRAREYERTCADCGQAWRVPRWAARPHPLRLTMSMRSGVVWTANAAVASDTARVAVAANAGLAERASASRVCPACNSVHYTQRPIRS
jgi:hypothetical protein